MELAESNAASVREQVSRDRAAYLAIGLADAGGIKAISMRKLARCLGIEAMSLYHHVKSKEDLLDSMVDIVLGEIRMPPAGAKWKAAMRERAESTRSVLKQHGWIVNLMDSRTTKGILCRHDAVAGCLSREGFSVEMAAHALSLLDSYVLGFALREASLPLDTAGCTSAANGAIIGRQLLTTAFPHLAEIAVKHLLLPGYLHGKEFQFGLKLILDGVDAAYSSSRPLAEVTDAVRDPDSSSAVTPP